MVAGLFSCFRQSRIAPLDTTKKGVKKKGDRMVALCGRRRPTLPRFRRSTIGARGFNFSVRNGKRWYPLLSSPYAFYVSPSRAIDFHGKQGTSSPGKPRAISTARLCRRRLYTCGLSTSSSSTALHGSLIFRRVSHLDAFSAYLFRAWLPSGAAGTTTGTPEARPSRSSRTRDSPRQASCAHNR